MGLPRPPDGAPLDRAEDARGRGGSAPRGLEGVRVAAQSASRASVERPDGARIAFDVAGDPRREPILLLGGIGGEASTWRREAPILATELFVVLLEHRGLGRSEAPDAPATMRAYADDAVAVLDELLLERVHVYGHSFGGQVALELAFEHPERVRTLVLGATRLGGEPANAPRAHAPLGRPWELLYSRGFLEAHPEEIRADRDALTRRHDVERRQAAASREWDARDRAAALSMPVLVLHGTDDRLVDPASGRRLAEAIPGAELALLDGAGHAYGSEVPEAAAAIVLDFVRRHRGGQA